MASSKDYLQFVLEQLSEFIRIVYYMPHIANPRLDRGDALDWGQR